MKPSVIIALLIGVLVVLGGLFYALNGNNDTEETVATETIQAQPTQNEPELETEQSEATELSEYTLADVASRNSKENCWTVIEGLVYDITLYVNRHPGGNAIELACGTDGTSLFTQRETADGEQIGSGTPHSTSAERQLSSYQIGVLVD